MSLKSIYLFCKLLPLNKTKFELSDKIETFI